MLKSIMIVLLMVGISNASNIEKYKRELAHMSAEQKNVLVTSLSVGLGHDLAYTMAAVAWTESQFGKYKMNLADGGMCKYPGSYGVYHSLLKTVMARVHPNGTSWQASRLAQKLIEDIGYSSRVALEDLEWWRLYWTNKGVPAVWSHTVASYNAGFKSVNSPQGKKYRDIVLARVKAIKWYLNDIDMRGRHEEKERKR